MSTDRLMSVPEVAEYLGIPQTTIYQWNYQRTGPPAFRVGRHLRFKRDDVEAWLRRRALNREDKDAH